MTASFIGVRSCGPLSVICLTALSGCADMLGLGGLTFDQGLDTSGTGGAPVDFVTAGGTGGDVALGGMPYEDADFPRQVARNALIATAPHQIGAPHYWIYEPGGQTLGVFQYDPHEPDAVGIYDWSGADDFTHLSVIPTSDGGETLIGYNQVSGFVSQLIAGDNKFEYVRVSEDYGTSGRSHLLPVFVGAEWMALTYSQADGSYRYFRPHPSDEPEVVTGQWAPGLEAISAFATETWSGVLKLSATTGVLEFDGLSDYGSTFENVFELPVEADLMATFYTGSRWAVVLYQSGSGEAGVYEVEEEAGDFELRALNTGTLRGDLTNIQPMQLSEGPVAITFSSASGMMVVRDLLDVWDGLIVVR